MDAQKSSRIEEIIAKYDNRKPKVVEPDYDTSKPPTTFPDFLKYKKVDEWPLRMASENMSTVRNEMTSETEHVLQSAENIYEYLKKAAPITMEPLDKLEERLLYLESKLNVYADQILTDEPRPSRLKENLFYAPPKAFMTEMGESDAVKVHHSRKREAPDSVEESNKKSVEFCVFPGFRHGELTELPGQLEAPQLLHRITKAQDFNAGFKKFWKKIFLSEASITIMQDTFWWISLSLFQKKSNEADKDLLYDRIADSFVALFTSINPDIKDKFFQVYADCLTQSLWTAFYEAFPDSRNRFQNDFKQKLCDITSEWVTGLKALPDTWKEWKIRKLVVRPVKGTKSIEKHKASRGGDGEDKHHLDFDGFEKLVMSLGNDDTRSGSRSSVSRFSRNWKTAGLAVLTGNVFGKKVPESHKTGPGPSFERVMFNIDGRSPLVSHYLYMRQLKGQNQPGNRVRRTEIAAMPPPAPTYRDVINQAKQLQSKMKREYQKISDDADVELLKLEKKQIETSREIEKLKHEINSARLKVALGTIDKKLDDPNASVSGGLQADIDSASDEG